MIIFSKGFENLRFLENVIIFTDFEFLSKNFMSFTIKAVFSYTICCSLILVNVMASQIIKIS
jgi:hypothetical protein